MTRRERYNRAVGVAEFIIEGHTKNETAEEFGIAKTTVYHDLEFLFYYCSQSHEEREKNRKLYLVAKKCLYDNQHNRNRKQSER